VGYPERFEIKPELETVGWLDRLPLRDVVFDEIWDGTAVAD
jgi:hypothetical protein